MDDLLLETAETRVESYQRRSEMAANLASRASVADVAATYLRLAECWGKLAAAVERIETAAERDAA